MEGVTLTEARQMMRARRDGLAQRIADQESTLQHLRVELAEVDGQLKGLDLAEKLLGAPAPIEAKRQRRDLRSEVRELLSRPDAEPMTVKQIAEWLAIKPGQAQASVDALLARGAISGSLGFFTRAREAAE
jgi:hypothetical protein